MLTQDELLEKIEQLVAVSTPPPEYYDVETFSKMIQKSALHVRNMLRAKRIIGERKASGRGPFKRWKISHAEYLRFMRDGLLPPTE